MAKAVSGREARLRVEIARSLDKAGTSTRKGGTGGTSKSANKPRAAASRRGSYADVPPHEHCHICRIPIAVGLDPALCEKTSCHEAHRKKKRTAANLRILMYILLAIALFPFVLLVIR